MIRGARPSQIPVAPICRFTRRNDTDQILAPFSTSTCRGPVRMLMMKPAKTSTIEITNNKKNVDVPAALTRRNSISMATNKIIDRT
jgi:hypothetical protein